MISGMTSLEQATREIEKLRQHRAWKVRDQSIGPIVLSTQKQAARIQRKLGALIELWESLVPPDLAARTRITGLRGGVAYVVADSASVGYELDRRLREGLLLSLRSSYRSTLTRVRVTIGPPG